MITWNCMRCGDHRHAPCGKPLCGQGDDNLNAAIEYGRRARTNVQTEQNWEEGQW